MPVLSSSTIDGSELILAMKGPSQVLTDKKEEATALAQATIADTTTKTLLS
jgi:hypothetical protein